MYKNFLATVAGTAKAFNLIPFYSLYVNQHKNYCIFEYKNQEDYGYI